jgi:hypothetical protein
MDAKVLKFPLSWYIFVYFTQEVNHFRCSYVNLVPESKRNYTSGKNILEFCSLQM